MEWKLPHCTKVYTFDALDTLYTFKAPVGNQYLEVARRCGLQRSVQPQALEQAFKVVYKDLITQYPNYGKDKLPGPQEWWAILIKQTFAKATNGVRLPPKLTDELYRHFSSGAAYKLFPEVKPMFQRLRKSRKVPLQNLSLFSQQWLNIPVTGVITNSDPRAIRILRDLGLKVGTVEPQRVLNGTAVPGWFGSSKVVESDWNPDNDIDFICTSYDAGSEKPNKAIFDHAVVLAGAVVEAMITQSQGSTPRNDFSFDLLDEFRRHRELLDWCHVGDDFEKDYRGALSWGARWPYYLKRGAGPTADEVWFMNKRKVFMRDLSGIWANVKSL